MKKILLFLPLVILIGLGCTLNQIQQGEVSIVLRQDQSGENLSLKIDSGNNWISTKKEGLFIINVLPQFAVWLEDTDHNLLETLYVSGADYDKLRNSQKQELGSDYFRQCLPLWAEKVTTAGIALPDPSAPYPDSMTSATPMDSFDLLTKTSVLNQDLCLFLEINQPGDYNADYSEDSTGWLGQPALVYSLIIPAHSSGVSIELALTGHSGNQDSMVEINPDLTDFDSALQIIGRAMLYID